MIKPVEPGMTRLYALMHGFALAFALLLALPLPLGAADQVWEGNAAIVRRGEFSAPGFFAASDSFPKNTLLEVENPQNGRTVRVTVVERANGRGNVFLLLSEQAAAALGFSSSDVIRVRSRVVATAGTSRAGAGLEDQASNPDQDLNPAAALAGPPPALSETPPAAAAAPQTSQPTTPQAAQPAATAAPEVSLPAAGQAQAEKPEAALPGQPAEPQPAEQPPALSMEATGPQQEAPAVAMAPAEAPPEEPPAPEVAAAPPEAETPPEVAAAPPVAEALPEAAQPEAAPATPPAAEVPQAAPPETGQALSPTEQRLEELAGRLPQKQLFHPPPESEALAAPPAEVAPVEPAPAPEEALAPEAPPVEAAPAEPLPEQLPPETSLGQPEAAPAEEAPLAEAQAEEEAPALSLGAPSAETQEGQAEGLAEPGAQPEAEAPSLTVSPPAVEEAPAEVAPQPAPVQAPPEVAVAPAAPLAPEIGAANLVRKSFYLQLGAYSTRSLADKLAKDLSSSARYTVEVLPSRSGDHVLYKVLIGPLNRDESGTLLFQFRARGFKDAFVQYVE